MLLLRRWWISGFVTTQSPVITQAQGEGSGVVSHSSAVAHERLGTRSIASVTANTHRATVKSIFTANPFIAISFTLDLLSSVSLMETIVEGVR